MKSLEELRLAALNKGKDFCEEHETDLNTIPEYAALKIEYDNCIKKVVNARAINMQDITPYAAAKDQTQSYMIDLIFMYELRSAVKAHEANKFELEVSLSKPKNYLKRGDDAAIGVRAEEIKNIIKNNVAILTNILPADITKMEDAIAAYQDILAAPQEAIDNRKAFGTARITPLLNDADIPKINLGKLILSHFPDLSPGWEQAIKVGKSSGARHTSLAIMFLVVDTKLKLKNVVCTLTNGVKTHICKSSRLGWVRFYSLTTDTWTATCQLPSFETFIISGIKIDDYHTEKHYVFLKKLNPANNDDNNQETTTGILSITILDKESGKPVSGAIIEIPALSHTFTTAEQGFDLLTGIAQGNYQGTVKCTSYKPLDFNFESKAGKTTYLTLSLEKESNPT